MWMACCREPTTQSMAWPQVCSPATSTRPCTWVSGWRPEQCSSIPTIRPTWLHLLEASSSLALAKTSVSRDMELTWMSWSFGRRLEICVTVLVFLVLAGLKPATLRSPQTELLLNPCHLGENQESWQLDKMGQVENYLRRLTCCWVKNSSKGFSTFPGHGTPMPPCLQYLSTDTTCGPKSLRCIVQI